MGMELREEKREERRFILTRGGDPLLFNERIGAFTEAELREILEQGAIALGIGESDWTKFHSDYELRQVWKDNARLRVVNHQLINTHLALAKENTRLEGWLKAIKTEEDPPPYECCNVALDMARRALAGEKAPGSTSD